MGLYSPNQEPKDSKGKIYLINPSVNEFTTSYFNDKNQSVEVILAPLETKAFPASIGRIVLNHLVDFILNQSKFAYKTSINVEKAKIKERCVVYE